MPQTIRRRKIKGYLYFYLMIDGKTVGMAQVIPKIKYLSNCVIYPQYRGNGYGTKLLIGMMSDKNRPVRLTASPEHGPGESGLSLKKLVKFYEKFGFRADNKNKNTHGVEMRLID